MEKREGVKRRCGMEEREREDEDTEIEMEQLREREEKKEGEDICNKINSIK